MRSDSATAVKTAGQPAVRRALSSAVGKDKGKGLGELAFM